MTAKRLTRAYRAILALAVTLFLLQPLWAVTISEYALPASNSGPVGITAGPDNAIWFVEYLGNKIGRIDPKTFEITEYSIPTENSGACISITTGPDGALWFTEGGNGDTPNGANRIGRIDPKTHVITDYPIPTPNSGPAYIVSGSDGALWFTEQFAGKIGRIDPKTHVITEYPTPTPNSDPWGITNGPDGAIWFTESNSNQIGRIDPKTYAITEYAIGSGGGCIILGADGAFWFTDRHANQIARFDPITHDVSRYSVPTAGSNPDIIAIGPDGAVWIAEFDADNIARMDPLTHAITEYAVSSGSGPGSMIAGPDGALWFTEVYGNKIGRIPATPAAGPVAATFVPLSAQGANTAITMGTSTNDSVGYATLSVNSGHTPYGTAVFSLKQKGITVSEVGVPMSVPTTSARVFIDFRKSVLAVPGRSNSGQVNITTGIAVVNPGYADAHLAYILRDASGATIASGDGTSAARSHFSCFIDELKNKASNFSLPDNFQANTQFGSLDIVSDQPVSVLAIRATSNQRNEFIMTTTPVADLTRPADYNPVYFPHFADGGGYTTSLVLMNPSSGIMNGTLEIMDDHGDALAVKQAGGSTDWTFPYSIPSGGIYRFQTDGSPENYKIGWIRVIPDGSSPSPSGSGIFSYNPADVLVSESGIPAANAVKHARIYVDLSNNHDTGLAVANIANDESSIVIQAFQADGVTPAGTGGEPLALAAKAHKSAFAAQFVAGLPPDFTGVLDIYSETFFSILTLRSLTNERGDFLMTTFPVADTNETPPSPIVFPQVADGGGYTTQFILISADSGAGAVLSYFDHSGAPMAVGR